MVDEYKEIEESDAVGTVSKGLGDVRGIRHRILTILRQQPNKTMFVADLVREISTDVNYYQSRDTLNFHLGKMADAGLLKIEDVPLEKKSEEGRLKIQAVVTLKKDVRVFVRDL